MPYVSKTQGINLIDLATSVILGKKLKDAGVLEPPPINHVGVKVPQFSFMRLSGADPVLGVEMLSTGEVACLGENFTDALSKAFDSADLRIPPAGGSILITVGGKELKQQIIPLAKELTEKGFRIYATEHTAEALRNAGIERVIVLHKVREPDKKPNIVDFIEREKINLVINIPMLSKAKDQEEVLKDEYTIRRLAVEFNVPVLTNLQLASAFVGMLSQAKDDGLIVRSLNEYTDSLVWNRR
jgi:carbamoyl-phosphate synthase large subunit